MSDEQSVGELLAGFGGDTDMLTDYFCGQIDEDGNPTEYYDGPDASVEQDGLDDVVDGEGSPDADGADIEEIDDFETYDDGYENGDDFDDYSGEEEAYDDSF